LREAIGNARGVGVAPGASDGACASSSLRPEEEAHLVLLPRHHFNQLNQYFLLAENVCFLFSARFLISFHPTSLTLRLLLLLLLSLLLLLLLLLLLPSPLPPPTISSPLPPPPHLPPSLMLLLHLLLFFLLLFFFILLPLLLPRGDGAPSLLTATTKEFVTGSKTNQIVFEQKHSTPEGLTYFILHIGPTQSV